MQNRLSSTLHLQALGLIAVALGATAALVLPVDSPPKTTTAAVPEVNRHKRLDHVRASRLIVVKSNQLRREHDLDPVEVNSKLAETAAYFASQLARTDRFSHTADGKTPSERAGEHGYDYCRVSENIAYVSGSAKYSSMDLANAMIEIWRQSPEHRTNILDPDVTESGIAIAQSGNTGRFYGVQIFGRPKSLSIAFAINNRSDVPIEYIVGERRYKLLPANGITHQECFPIGLRFQLPGESKAQRHTHRPRNGDQVIVTGRANELRIEIKTFVERRKTSEASIETGRGERAPGST